MVHIIEGDGSFKEAMDSGRCPRCKVQAPCGCGLTIVEGSSNMNETKLMPTEEDLSANESMSWTSAVMLIEGLIMDEAEDVEHQDGSPELADEIRAAWKRILQG